MQWTLCLPSSDGDRDLGDGEVADFDLLVVLVPVLILLKENDVKFLRKLTILNDLVRASPLSKNLMS